MEDWQLYQRDKLMLHQATTSSPSLRNNSQAGYLRLLAESMMDGEARQRPALAQRVGLSRLAISELLSSLESRGLVTVEGLLGGAPGRSHLSYSLRPDAALALGFDVGGTKVAGALVDLLGRIVVERSEATDRSGAEGLASQLARMADELFAEAGVPRFRLHAAAAGVPAAVHPATAELSLAGNLPGLESNGFQSRLCGALGIDILIDNDVNLALLAESATDIGASAQNVAFIGLGTGIGGALMVNGRLLRGAHGGAGELGYMPLWSIESPGVAALEDRVGEAGIRRSYVALGGDSDHSVRDIFVAAEDGSTPASTALDEAASHVARAVLTVLAVLDIDRVVFGGSIGARPEFIARVDRVVRASWMRPIAMTGSQHGSRAGLIGALELARRHLLDDLFGPAPVA